MPNIVFEPVKIYTDKIGCTLVKVWTKTSYFIKNIFIMQLPGEFSPFIEKKSVFCLVVFLLSGPTSKKTLFFVRVSSLSPG